MQPMRSAGARAEESETDGARTQEPETEGGRTTAQAELARLLARLLLELNRSGGDPRERLGLQRREFALLAYLVAEGTVRPKDLSLDLGIPASSLSHMLERLEGQGLLRRARNAHDLRSKDLEATPAARAELCGETPVWTAAAEALLAPLAADERDLLRRLLRRMVAAEGG